MIVQLFPKADDPVVQLGLDRNLNPSQHCALACELSSQRRKGVLIVGSGNMVHNLGVIDRHNPGGGFDWAQEASARMKQLITSGDHNGSINYAANGRAFQLSIPMPEHYLPLLYTLALKDEKEPVSLFNDRLVMGSIAMTSLRIG